MGLHIIGVCRVIYVSELVQVEYVIRFKVYDKSSINILDAPSMSPWLPSMVLPRTDLKKQYQQQQPQQQVPHIQPSAQFFTLKRNTKLNQE